MVSVADNHGGLDNPREGLSLRGGAARYHQFLGMPLKAFSPQRSLSLLSRPHEKR